MNCAERVSSPRMIAMNAALGTPSAVMWPSNSGPVASASRRVRLSLLLAQNASSRCAGPSSCASRASRFSPVSCRKKLSNPVASVAAEKPVCAGPSFKANCRNG